MEIIQLSDDYMEGKNTIFIKQMSVIYFFKFFYDLLNKKWKIVYEAWKHDCCDMKFDDD